MSTNTERLLNIEEQLEYLSSKIDKDMRFIKDLLRKIYFDMDLTKINKNTEN
tara:strand:+ start:97 stop:252 length:156 start_codon:yes stop_codon:yes gene_type:complete